MSTTPITKAQFDNWHTLRNGCHLCHTQLQWEGEWATYTANHTLYCNNCAGMVDGGNSILKRRTCDVQKEALTAKEGFTFGCDPELFIVNSEGRPVSAAGLIPGTKENPHKVDKGAVQVDGMAAEFNTDPASTFEEFNENIVTVMKQLKDMLPSGYGFLIEPSVVFDETVFNAAPDSAKELGCVPDFNAWTGQMNPPPFCADNPFLRTAAGHVHLGWKSSTGLPFALDDPQHMMNCRDLAKQLDWYLGAWSLRIDKDTARRSLYGGAGAIRIKDYGVEYRTLSNFWITSKERRLTVWNRMQQAIADMRGSYQPDRYPGLNDKLVAAINSSNLPKLLESEAHYPIVTIQKNIY